MKIASVLPLIFWGMLLYHPAHTQRGQVKSVKGIFLRSIHVAFEQFRRDMAKEGFIANLADYSIEYQQLIHGYKENSRALSIITETQYKSFNVRISQLGYRQKEPVPLPREKPDLLAEMNRAYKSFGFTLPEILELLFSTTCETFVQTRTPRRGCI